MVFINPSKETKGLRDDLKEFAKKWFGPDAVLIFSDDAPVLKEIMVRYCRLEKDMDMHEYIVSMGSVALSNEMVYSDSIVSDAAAKELCRLFKKWGHLKDTAEIVEGVLTIPYKDIVTLDLKLFAFKRARTVYTRSVRCSGGICDKESMIVRDDISIMTAVSKTDPETRQNYRIDSEYDEDGIHEALPCGKPWSIG